LFPSARPYDNDPELSNDPKGEIVYLSAEADEVMDEFDPSKAYVIGGIVDRNRHKGLTDRKAQAQGIKRVRLPIGEYLRMRSTKVLTVNHVFEILLKMYEHGDWKTALQAVMPERKVAKDGQK
jgi:tRNA (guanine9-N1)-methyltransferase